MELSQFSRMRSESERFCEGSLRQGSQGGLGQSSGRTSRYDEYRILSYVYIASIIEQIQKQKERGSLQDLTKPCLDFCGAWPLSMG